MEEDYNEVIRAPDASRFDRLIDSESREERILRYMENFDIDYMAAESMVQDEENDAKRRRNDDKVRILQAEAEARSQALNHVPTATSKESFPDKKQRELKNVQLRISNLRDAALTQRLRDFINSEDTAFPDDSTTTRLVDEVEKLVKAKRLTEKDEIDFIHYLPVNETFEDDYVYEEEGGGRRTSRRRRKRQKSKRRKTKRRKTRRRKTRRR